MIYTVFTVRVNALLPGSPSFYQSLLQRDTRCLQRREKHRDGFFNPVVRGVLGGVVPGSMHKHLKNWGENSEIGSLASLLCVGNGNGMLCRGIPVRVVPLSL